jgi:hypothetical protein
MTRAIFATALVMLLSPACSFYDTGESCETNPRLCQQDSEAVCLAEGTFTEDVSRYESMAAAELIREAFVENSDEKLVEFLDTWARRIGPVTCDRFEQKSETVQEAYRLFRDYYDPFNLEQYGDPEWGPDVYAGYDYVVVQKRAAAEIPGFGREEDGHFRPVVEFENATVLYLTDEYEHIIEEFLEESQELLWERIGFLRTHMPIDPGHWGGWHIVTCPHVGLFEFQPGLHSALVYFSILYEGGQSTLVKNGDAWKLIGSQLTWIE